MTSNYTLTVGGHDCDIQGFTNVHIQCAVDRVALLGGGAVELGAGVFAMADSLHLRSGVTVKGQGAQTVLRKNAMKQARVTTFLGYGHVDLIVDEPDVFAPGDGYIIGDDNSFGFYQTVGTLVARDGNEWTGTHAHVHDYRRIANAFVKTLFPVVSAVDVERACVCALVVDGNAEQNETMNACRGAGVFGHRAHYVVVRDVVVRDYRGEGIGFQTCDDFEAADCTVERCTGNGLHPGSGSNRFHLHGCCARDCGGDGLFYCLRARHGVLERCVFESNAGHGVSIGGRDTDNVNRELTIRDNGGAGIWLREGGADIAPHNNVIQDCTIERNCRTDGPAEVVLQGETEGIQLIGNRIVRRADKAALLIKSEMGGFENRDNVIEPMGENAIVDERVG